MSVMWKFTFPPKTGTALWPVYDTMLLRPDMSEEDVFRQHEAHMSSDEFGFIPEELRRPMFAAFYATVKSKEEEDKALRRDHADPATPHRIRDALQLLADLRQEHARHPSTISLRSLDTLEHQKVDPDLRRSEHASSTTYQFSIEHGEREAKFIDTCSSFSALPGYFTVNELTDAVIPLLRTLLRTVTTTPPLEQRVTSDLHVERRERLAHVADVLQTLTAYGLTTCELADYKRCRQAQAGYIRGTPGLPWDDDRYDRLTPICAMRDHTAAKLLGEGPRPTRTTSSSSSSSSRRGRDSNS